VGLNLQDHLRVSVRWTGRHPLPPSTVTAGLFTWSRAEARQRNGVERSPDLQYYVGRGLAQTDPFVTITVAHVKPQSRGLIQLRSARPEDPPLVRANYLQDPEDVTALVAGVRLARAFGNARAYDGLRAEEIDPGPSVRTDQEIAAFVRRAADTIFHPAGTCRMGRDDGAVVDAELRVHATMGLRVADASIMPAVVNAPTHAACVMIGEMAADLIQKRAFR
jgi:choline dehydrogenase